MCWHQIWLFIRVDMFCMVKEENMPIIVYDTGFAMTCFAPVAYKMFGQSEGNAK